MVAQILALAIFVVMFGLIISEKFERHVITLVCGLATLVLVFGVAMHSMDAILETLNIRNIFTLSFWYEAGASSESTGGINWATIIFLAGMMVMVEGMAKAGFFRWLCMTIAKAVRYRVIPIFITFMIMSFVLAMFIDSITVILFLAAVTVELAQLLDFNPIPLILSEIFCANLGGSATMCGDPPNIIVGTSLRYSFSDFITNTGLMAVLSLVVIIFYFYFCFRKELTVSSASQTSEKDHPSPVSAITDKRAFAISCVIFLCAVALLITHAQTGLTVAFIGLFVVVGGLEQTGILELAAGFIGKVSHGNAKVMIAIIIWVSAIASAFVDNIPFAATMIPVIKTLAASTGVDLSVLAWTLAMGTDIGGSATPIGASANVVGMSIAAKEGHPISWGKYCKVSAPASVIVILISMVCIYLRYF